MAPSSSPSSDKLPPFLSSAGHSIQSLTANILSHLPFSPPPKTNPPPLFTSSSSSSMETPFFFPLSSLNQNQGAKGVSSSSSRSPPSALRSLSSAVRVDGVSGGGGGGPAFVGQVFSMLDPSGNGLMAVTSHFDIPFLSRRTPDWIKKMLATVTKSEQNGPVFRFFMDLTDAVGYVKRLKIPTGVVGACRLDVAYEHFKEKPHLFKFVPNEKQVKAANKLLKEIPKRGGKTKVDGVPVFTAQNLNIAIATNDGIKWYTPYFFDKNLLDNILEASIDQHFHMLIKNRHMQRRRNIVDDGLTTDVVEESGDSLFEPPEVQQLMDELGHPGIPLNVISKIAEIQLLDVVDKVLLGNKWLRKATGIQPKLPYLVDSFEERSAAAYPKAAVSTHSSVNSGASENDDSKLSLGASDAIPNEKSQGQDQSISDREFQFPFGDWFSNPWPRLHGKQQQPDKQIKPNRRTSRSDGDNTNQIPSNPLLPKITMVGISVGEGGKMSRTNLKKTMEDLTKELEQASQELRNSNGDIDPLFVANVGDYSNISRMNST